jgi:PIN domain nuclease of toxin-antitoxin system
MKLLLDTHTLVWAIRGDPQLSKAAQAAIKSKGGDVRVSVVSAWEIAIKVGLGKWPEAEKLLNDFEAAIAGPAFALVPISVDHVRTAGLLRAAHRDPFDRLLAAQATIEGLTLVTSDPKMTGLGAPVLW